MKRLSLALFAAGCLLGCASELYKEDIKSAQAITKANARAYQLAEETDAGLPVRAFNAAAYCAGRGILLRHKLAVPEAGIDCTE